MKLLMSTKQFKMYLEEELVERLERIAERHGRRSAQQVAEEILLTYLPVWAAVSDAMARAVTYQSSQSQEAIDLTHVKSIGEMTDESKPKRRKTG